jgi:hypothetical protein
VRHGVFEAARKHVQQHHGLGWPQVSPRTLYRWVRLVAIWRRPKLTARGAPDHDHFVAQIMARLTELPRQAAAPGLSC